MRITITSGFLLAVLFLVCFPIQAKESLVPWSQSTHIKLSQCMIAEADESAEDHIAIAYAVKNWWQLRQKRYPTLRFTDVLNAYCSVHKLSTERLSQRQSWIRQLSFPTKKENGFAYEKPSNFPDTASWERKKRIWAETLKRAQEWNDGKHKDPCKGEAIHWGAPQDPNSKWYLPSDEPSESLERVICDAPLENWYYKYKTKWEKI